MKTDTVENLGAVKSSEIIVSEQENASECGINCALDSQEEILAPPGPRLPFRLVQDGESLVAVDIDEEALAIARCHARLEKLAEAARPAIESPPIPTELYRHFDKTGRLLYVGISFSTIARAREHRQKSSWFDSVATITIERLPSRRQALNAEAAAIKNEKPLFNVFLSRRG